MSKEEIFSLLTRAREGSWLLNNTELAEEAEALLSSLSPSQKL